MRTRLPWILLSTLLAGAAMLQPARADVYTWVDKSGSINVSNLAPPDGAHVTSVIHASPAEVAAHEAAAREAARQAEVQALAERVRQLESEVQMATYQAATYQPPPVQYRAAPPPPMIQYIADPTPPYAANSAPQQYAPYGVPPPNYCDASSIDCGIWGYSGFYPASVIVLRAPISRRPPPHRDGGHYAVHQPMPMRPSMAMHRG